jgi:hypothetical protein
LEHLFNHRIDGGILGQMSKIVNAGFSASRGDDVERERAALVYGAGAALVACAGVRRLGGDSPV